MGGDGWGWGEPRERQAHRGALVRCAPDRFEPGGSDDGMTITILTFFYRYVCSQSWMNLQLRYHLGFAPLSLLCHHRLYPTVPCAFSLFPRTSNAILYLLAACRNIARYPRPTGISCSLCSLCVGCSKVWGS